MLGWGILQRWAVSVTLSLGFVAVIRILWPKPLKRERGFVWVPVPGYSSSRRGFNWWHHSHSQEQWINACVCVLNSLSLCPSRDQTMKYSRSHSPGTFQPQRYWKKTFASITTGQLNLDNPPFPATLGDSSLCQVDNSSQSLQSLSIHSFQGGTWDSGLASYCTEFSWLTQKMESPQFGMAFISYCIFITMVNFPKYCWVSFVKRVPHPGFLWKTAWLVIPAASIKRVSKQSSGYWESTGRYFSPEIMNVIAERSGA